MNIGLDFDGVIIDWQLLKSDALRFLYNITIPPEQLTRTLALNNKLTSSEQYDALIEFIYKNKDAMPFMQPLKDSIATIQNWQRQGHVVKIITARSPEWREIVELWLKSNGLSMEAEYTNFTPKGPFCKNLDIFIDDDYRQLATTIGIVPRPLLFSHWYNTHEKIENPCKRMESWKEISDFVKNN